MVDEQQGNTSHAKRGANHAQNEEKRRKRSSVEVHVEGQRFGTEAELKRRRRRENAVIVEYHVEGGGSIPRQISAQNVRDGARVI